MAAAVPPLPLAALFSLCNCLQLPPSTTFAALELFVERLPPADPLQITPTAKHLVLVPLQVTAAGSVLAAVLQAGGAASQESAAARVHAAAGEILGPEYTAALSVDALLNTVKEIMHDSGPEKKPSSTARVLEELHGRAATAAPEAAAGAPLAVCFRLLELLCLEHGGSKCSALMRQGGALVAAAVIAAAFCIAAPMATVGAGSGGGGGGGGGSTLLATLSALTGYPDDVIRTQAQSYLHLIVSPL